MTKSNLMEILKTFSGKELKEFSSYLNSPFFNKNESILKLYEYVRRYYPAFDDKKLEKEFIYSKIFPGAKYNDGFMRTIMFNLSGLAEEFMAFKHYKEDQYQEKINLLQEYNKRDIKKTFQKTVKELNEILSGKKVRDANYFHTLYKIEDENLSYYAKIYFERMEKFVDSSGMDNIFNNLTYFYLLRMLKFYVFVLNTRSIFNINFKTELIENILTLFKPESFESIPMLKIYFYMVILHLREEEEDNYFGLKSTLEKNVSSIDEETRLECFINLENYCWRKVRNGERKFTRELFDIYKMELDNMNYNHPGKLPHKLFFSLVVTGLSVNEIEWVKDFMDKNKGFMPDEFKENTYIHCLALFTFSTKNFDEALKITSKIKYVDIYQKFELKCLILAIYYELNLEEQFFANQDSLRHTLTNETMLPDDNKKHYMIFLRYSKKLMKLRNNYNSAEIDELERQMKLEKTIYNENWLFTKLDELKHK